MPTDETAAAKPASTRRAGVARSKPASGSDQREHSALQSRIAAEQSAAAASRAIQDAIQRAAAATSEAVAEVAQAMRSVQSPPRSGAED